jgi:hypothetical protein
MPPSGSAVVAITVRYTCMRILAVCPMLSLRPSACSHAVRSRSNLSTASPNLGVSRMLRKPTPALTSAREAHSTNCVLLQILSMVVDSSCEQDAILSCSTLSCACVTQADKEARRS